MYNNRLRRVTSEMIAHERRFVTPRSRRRQSGEREGRGGDGVGGRLQIEGECGVVAWQTAVAYRRSRRSLGQVRLKLLRYVWKYSSRHFHVNTGQVCACTYKCVNVRVTLVGMHIIYLYI